ncbi:MAG: hypothetical protein HY815_18510 [Candidatus Riflebacteria bacterium]|nr:hypothetical protein [Candidatus Riflebacteria bacterium]
MPKRPGLWGAAAVGLAGVLLGAWWLDLFPFEIHVTDRQGPIVVRRADAVKGFPTDERLPLTTGASIGNRDFVEIPDGGSVRMAISRTCWVRVSATYGPTTVHVSWRRSVKDVLRVVVPHGRVELFHGTRHGHYPLILDLGDRETAASDGGSSFYEARPTRVTVEERK